MGGTLEMISAQAELLAAITVADGKILDVEHRNAASILNRSRVEQATNLYNKSITLSEFSDVSSCLNNQITKLDVLSFAHKLKFIEGLWQVAVCDDELHLCEERLIYTIIDGIGLSRRESIQAQRNVSVVNFS